MFDPYLKISDNGWVLVTKPSRQDKLMFTPMFVWGLIFSVVVTFAEPSNVLPIFLSPLSFIFIYFVQYVCIKCDPKSRTIRIKHTFYGVPVSVPFWYNR